MSFEIPEHRTRNVFTYDEAFDFLYDRSRKKSVYRSIKINDKAGTEALFLLKNILTGELLINDLQTKT